MNRLPARTILSIGILLVLSVTLAAAAQEEELRPPVQASRFVSLSVGPTKAVNPEENLFERVLFTPPGEDMLEAGATWEIGMGLAIELGGKTPAERWRAIRRNLGLSPDDKTDFLLWREVVDDLFSMLGTLSQRAGGPPDYGLRVAFPGNAPARDSKAEVALTFDPVKKDGPKKPGGDAGTNGFEDDLITALLRAVTGVEGTVSLVDPDGNPVTGDWLSKYPGLKLRLKDAEGNVKDDWELKDYPYFCFSRVPGVPEWGGDFWLDVTGGEDGPLGDESEPGQYVPVMEAQYVPIRPGMRTRQDITLKLERALARPRAEVTKSLELDIPKSLGLEEAGTAVQDAIGTITAMLPPLGLILNQLPPNPGVHFGVVQTREAGPQLFFSARFKFKAEVHDRSPRFVSRGTLRLQVMTTAAGAGQTPAHYIKVIWCGHASEADLSLTNRPVSRFPLGLGLGIVPPHNENPALYSAGLSYKLLKGLEIYAGAGFRKESPTSFVYGLTLDVESVLSIIGKFVGKEDE